MKRGHIKEIVFLLLVFLQAACGGPEDYGTLQGHVSIGPLVPVVREGEPEPTPAPEVYEARKIVVYDANGRDEVTVVDIDAFGNYSVELPVGIYMVDINRLGIDSASGLPAQVEIAADQVFRLDVDIDTGIR